MVAKFDVDEKVYATGKVVEINTTDEGTVYQVKIKSVNGSQVLNIEEDELTKINVDNEDENVEPDNNPVDGE